MSELASESVSTVRPPQLEVSDLRVQVAGHQGVVRPIDGVSLEIAPGEAVGLVGESGSGKSMTLKSILGLLPPDAKVTSGSIVFDGTDLTRLPHSRLNKIRGRRIAMIFQEPMSALNPVMRVGNQIAEGPRVHLGLSRAQSVERAVDLMRRVGIPEPERRFRAFPHEFSGGMRQRVMIAMALSCDPELILCDEPTTALDVTIQDQILRLLAQLCHESGTSLMFVTHDLPVVAQVCHKVAVMYAGRIVERGTVSEVFSQPTAPLHPGPAAVGARHRSSRPVPGTRSPARRPAWPARRPAAGSIPAASSPTTTARSATRRCACSTGDRATACLHYERCLRPDRNRRMSEQDILEATGIEVSFSVGSPLGARLRHQQHLLHAVDGVDLSVRRGEALALVGESGSGKSTLARAIAGIQRANRGQIKLDGKVLPAPAGPAPISAGFRWFSRIRTRRSTPG